MTNKFAGDKFAVAGLASAILESPHALVVVLDTEGRFETFNRACELLTGYAADEMVGSYIWDRLLPDEDIGSLQGYFSALQSSGEFPEESETDWIACNGSRATIVWNNNIVRNSAGAIERVVSVGVDITERKTAAERLARAQRIAGIGSWELKVETGDLHWSDQFYTVLGLNPQSIEASLENLEKYVHPDDRKRRREKFRHSIAAAEPFSSDFRIIRSDGTERLIHEEAEFITDDAGKAVSLTGSIQDVTDLRESDSRLQRLTRGFTNAQRIAKIGNWDWDVVTGDVWWSDELYRILGLEPGSVAPSYDKFLEMCHPDDRGKINATSKATQESLSSYEIVFRIIQPDGEERILRGSGEAVIDDRGRLAGMTGIVQDITQRHLRQRELSETAQRLEAAMQIARLGNWEWTPSTNRLAMSDETLRICGLGPQHAEVDNDFLMAMIPVEEHEQVQQYMEEAVSTGGAYTSQYHIIRPDGDKRTVLEHGAGIRDEATGEVRLLGTIQDITDKQRISEELALTLQRLDDSQKAAKIGSWEWDAELDRDWWSEQQMRNYGLDEPAGFVPGNRYLDFAHPDDREMAQDAVIRSIAEDIPLNLEFRTIGADGVERILWVYGLNETDRNGRVIRAFGTTQDITARKRIELALQENEARLRVLFDNAPVGIGLSDMRGHLIQANDAFATMLGYQRNEMPGLTYRDVTHPDYIDESEQQMKQLLAGEADTVTTEKIFVRKDGTGVWGTRTQSVVRDENGNPKFHVIVVEDIDDRKRAEAELAKTALRLQEAQRIAHTGDWEWNPETGESVWSDENYRIFGLEPDSLGAPPTHDKFLAIVHEDDRASLQNIMLETLETGIPYDTEFRIVRPNGEIRTIYERGECFTQTPSSERRIRGVLQDITERKAIEEELRETAEKLEKSQIVAKIGSWVWEVDSDKEWWSDEMYRIFGIEVGEVVLEGYGFLEYVHPHDRNRVRQAQDRSLREGVPYSVEYRLQRPDGCEAIISEYGEMEYDAEGNPLRMRGTTQDITERKAAERELRETKVRLEQAQELGQMGSWTWDPIEDVEWWSDQQYRIFGLQPGSVRLDGWGFLEYVHPDDRDRVEKIQRNAAETGAAFTVEYRIIRPDGTERVVSELGEWVEDSTVGNPHWRGVVQDITERKTIEEQLRETSKNLKKSQRIAKLGSWVWDMERDEEWWSDEIYRMLGWEMESIIRSGYDFLQTVHPDDRDRVRAALESAVAENGPFEVEYRVLCADGRELFISEHAEMEFDQAGKPVRMHGTTQDITDLKRVQLQLAQLNTELEQRVEERTAELRAAQTELVKNERLATLGQLTATVSHELRNPLGAMRSSIYVVRHKVDSQDERLLAAIDRVNRNITRCDQIIDELLDYTRIRDLHLQQTAIDEWLGAVLDEQPVPDGVSVERHFNAPGITLPVDTDRLRRAVINLYENACQSLTLPARGIVPDSGATVAVETRVATDKIEILVSDNGAGIPSEMSQKIFEPLFSTKSFGVGLGLPTVKRIIEQHGGGVEILENPGGGAKFALWLPLGGI